MISSRQLPRWSTIAILLAASLPAGGGVDPVVGDAKINASATSVQADQPAAPMAPSPTRDDGFRRYWLMIGIPGTLLGAAVIVTVAVLANRARRGKLERGELPEMPE